MESKEEELLFAALKGNLGYVKHLVSTTPNVYSLITKNRSCPVEYIVEAIKYAIVGGHPQVVEFLFDKCEEDSFPIQIWEDYLDTAASQNN